MSHFVSVIIPVFNDSKRLRVCLDALERQTYAHDSYEVIVIDNNSTEDIKSIVEGYQKVVYAFEVLPGSYAARNAGLAIAKGQIFAFTDSDCIPALDWIEKGVAALTKVPDTGLVAGQIEIFCQDLNAPTAVEIYDRYHFLRQAHYIENLHFGATANVFAFRSTFENVGLFNTSLKSGGDQEWGERVFAAGYRQIYDENVVIQHPARRDLEAIRRKVARVTEGHYRLEQGKQNSAIAKLVATVQDLKPPISWIWRILIGQDVDELRSNGLWLRLNYIFVILVLKYTRAWKKIQLRFQLSPQIEL